MTTRAVAEIREWERRRYAGGFAGLHDLADREFTGAVEADDHVCFVVRGRVVGVFEHAEGDETGAEADAGEGLRPAAIEAFEDADGTAYEAPHAALPLLFAMQATGGEERGRYYTEDTPLAEVHERLSGGFTGYVELSENVLSGDYYSVYHGGRAKHVAFVGQSGRLLEDEEAFERACDEVGIYTVTAVDLDVVDVPGGDDRGSAGAGTGPGTTGAAGAGGTGAADSADAGESAPGPEEARLDADIPDTGAGPTGEADQSAAPDTPAPRASDPDTPAEAVTPVDEPDSEETVAGRTVDEGTGTAADPTDEADIEAAVTAAETAPPGVDVEEESDEEGDQFRASDDGEDATRDGTTPSGTESDTGANGAAAEPAADEASGDVAALRSALAAREDEVARLKDEVDRLEEALQEARDERDDLAARVENLEGRLRELGAGDAAPETEMTPAEALAGTSLFVRYRSKGEPTLEDLPDGVSREAVVGNLRLEHHTEFDEDTVAVDGRQFDAFLQDTQAYRFARWLVTELPLEIRDTGNQNALSDLYGAVPDIDRIEFDATLADDRTFDLVGRSRMGEPLVVATLDDGRDPTGDEAMATLVKDATAVSEESPTLAAAMAVTGAFFDPEALATAEDATGGSLLSRDRRESYVKLSRGRGFHLCLVEDREESFYISIPEL